MISVRLTAPLLVSYAAAAAAAAANAAAVPTTGYLAAPTEQLAVPGMAAGAEVTPEGDVYTGWAEYELRFGRRLRAWNQPTRTLPEPGVPLLSSTLADGRVRYTVTLFAVPVAGRPVAYETVRAINGSARPRWARVQMLLARGPTAPGRPFATPGPNAPIVHGGRVFGVRLEPHRGASFTWRLPLEPPPAAAAAAVRSLDATGLGATRAALRSLWAGQEAGMMRIAVPEAKVNATYEAAIVQMLESRVQTATGWEQMPNRLQYRAFWIRDAAIATQALDLAGLHVAAAQNLAFIDAFQQPDGLFMSQAGQYDEWGEALWALAQHAELAGEQRYAAAQLGRMGAAIGWLSRVTAADPLGLLPASNPDDNELAYGHITGDDLWAAAGLRAAIAAAALARQAGAVATLAGQSAAAKLAGQSAAATPAGQSAAATPAEASADAAAWTAVEQRFEIALHRALAAAVAREGHIPPVLDAQGGQDWGNYWAAYPVPVLDPRSLAVTATLRWARAHMAEGLPTYLNSRELHDYLGFRIFQTELAAGDPADAVAGLYAELAHTTATDDGWETGVAPYGKRLSGTNLAPHGTFAAEYVALLRNLLVADTPTGGVRLLGGASPAWLAPGQRITVTAAPTDHGAISFTERATRRGETLAWHDSLAPGTPLSWALPWWARDARTATGPVRGAAIALRGSSGSLTVTFNGRRPAQSYARTVAALNAAYRAHGRPAPLVPATG
ncbi:MAG TPA: hypothetical protein VNV37_02565 [Solirubrobacteraceae bacterium]|nr:hypothetical protein [Solirubrobacteraceae bacterium]